MSGPWQFNDDAENPIGNTYLVSYDGYPALCVDAWAFIDPLVGIDSPPATDEQRQTAHEQARGFARRLVVLLNERAGAVFAVEDDSCCRG